MTSSPAQSPRPAADGRPPETVDRLMVGVCGAIWLVCAGTLENASFEDTLGAGALVDRLTALEAGPVSWTMDDSAQIAREVYRAHRHRLVEAAALARNGRRLLAQPELAGDVPVCLEEDRNPRVVRRDADGVLRPVA